MPSELLSHPTTPVNRFDLGLAEQPGDRRGLQPVPVAAYWVRRGRPGGRHAVADDLRRAVVLLAVIPLFRPGELAGRAEHGSVRDADDDQPTLPRERVTPSATGGLRLFLSSALPVREGGARTAPTLRCGHYFRLYRDRTGGQALLGLR